MLLANGVAGRATFDATVGATSAVLSAKAGVSALAGVSDWVCGRKMLEIIGAFFGKIANRFELIFYLTFKWSIRIKYLLF